MPVIKNFAEAHKVLRTFYNVSGSNTYTLDRMCALMEYLGNPQDSLKVIHVAGTSGKTSTVYYVAALLEATGANVGMTVSPHVDEVNERVQLNHTPFPEATFCKALGEFVDIVKGSGVTPSYFELLVAFAYWEFARQKVDYAVVEVGLGGLLDSTNVVSREDKVCIITDIGLDHTRVLGKILAEIAAQKAGIIQPKNHVFAYAQSQEIDSVLMRTAHKQQATLHRIVKADYYQPSLPLFQRRNLYLAEQAVNHVLTRDGKPVLSRGQIKIAARVRIPARMELFEVAGKTVIVDGSHNGQKLGTLAESIRAKFPRKSIAVLAAFVEGEAERWQRGVDELISLADSIIFTSFKPDQNVPKGSVNPEIVAKYCKKKGFEDVQIERTPKLALQKLLGRPEQILLVTGSFYLLNHIRPLIV
ncbi:MAG TPA: Mur ligase family protein [Candidatus Saccharimonadales bacterium]|jgi:dihydrofolate synthase/folylpolyglutamate synthase